MGGAREGLVEKEVKGLWDGVEGNLGPSDHAVLRFRSKVGDPAL